MREMKDSGVSWIGMIPNDWNLNKIGSLYEERNTKVSDTEYEPLSVTKQGIVPQLETAAKTDNGDNRKLIKKNDFVINSRSDRRGSCGISDREGSCSLINTVLKPRKDMINEYYSYVFKTESFADEYYRWGHGIVDDLWSTKWTDMKSIYIPFPSLDEQKRIADCLDTKCALIDYSINKQETIIEKLKEYKLSVITEAVTKGLNPNAEKKNTNLKWISSIPASWKPAHLSNFCAFLNGDRSSSYPSPEEYTSDGIPFIGADSLNNWFVDCSIAKHISRAKYDSMGGVKIKDGDILYTLRGSTIGKNSMANFTDGTVASSLMAIRVLDKSMLNPKFLLYFLNSELEFTQRDVCINGSTAPNLSADDVKRYSIFVPSLNEQELIVNYLDNKCNLLDERIGYLLRKCELLHEYKKSFIFEMVTGKKEAL